jgi:pimeloyl-ACP methyl ester carboxylesterase
MHALALVLAVQQPVFDSGFEQVSPAPAAKASERAIVLINGLKPHPFSKKAANEPRREPWQSADSKLGEALASHGDLFVFYYSQNRHVEEIPDAANRAGKAFGDYVAGLKAAGYAEIALVGHSAGGIIARQFVEDHPDAGVTRVVQTATPNAGAWLAELDDAVRDSQEPFVQSLSKADRKAVLAKRAGKRIPDGVEFTVVVANGLGNGDTVVSAESQWPPDLRAQGIPMVEVGSIHYTVPRSRSTAAKVAELVSTPQPRWSAEQVKRAHALLVGSRDQGPE